MITIREYKNALSELMALNVEYGQQKNITEREQKDVRDKYWELKRKIDDRKYKLELQEEKRIRNIDVKFSKYEYAINIKKQPYNDICNGVEDIFKMFDILISENVEPTVFNDILVKGKCLEVLEVLYDDKYKRVYVYIEKNDKPKNNLTLAIKGKSFFGYHFDKVNIGTVDIRYASTVIELTQWFRKNKDNLKWQWGWKHNVYLADIMERQSYLEKLYGDIQELWEKKGWRRVYWNYKKDYYENHYFRGTETEEYKNVLEQLRILK